MKWSAIVLALAACGDAPAVTGDPPLPGIAAFDPVLTARLTAATLPRIEPFTNRLALETSPYLLQHAHNPVSWYAWGDEAFERARREHKLVLVSIGYSTCHWCHVMEAESFSDEEVAAYVNATYVCIKVDREERPDVDALYMAAVQAMGHSGGWPLNVVVDAERRPVFGATYLGKAQLLGVLRQLRDVADREPERLDETSRQVVAHLSRAQPIAAGAVGPDAVERGARSLARVFDTEAGGFGTGTKFPSPPDLALLLRYHRRTNDADALAMVTFTLERIAAGGIHDHLGGGFHRYATDRHWRVPHFEKMLYDNAQLATLYLEAAQVTGDTELATITRTTLDYILREMSTEDGGFASATDADSRAPDGRLVEGRYFTWTPAEIDAVLGPELGSAMRAFYAVGGPAQVDGRSVLTTPRSVKDLAAVLGMAPEALAPQLEAARAKLLAARSKRPPPLRDDKVLTAWNALAISALARAGFAFRDNTYLDEAMRLAELVVRRARAENGGLYRSVRLGSARAAGTLEDYAYMTAALLDVFGATWEVRFLDEAEKLAAIVDGYFAAPQGGYFATDESGEQLLVRMRPTDDGVQPSGNAVAIDNLLRLAELTGTDRYRERAEKALASFAAELGAERRVPALRAALDRALDTPLEIVIVGASEVEREALLGEVRATFLPHATLVVGTDRQIASLARRVPFVEGKIAKGGRATAYVCERTICKLPVTDRAELAKLLAKVAPLR
jgi:uncharacterized protein YyaL (SSP411 family)